MAFISQDEEKKRLVGAQAVTNQPLNQASQALTPTTPGGTPGAPPSTSKGGSAFPDISRFLSQNQDSAKRTASNIANNVLDSQSEARKNLYNTQNQFNKQAGNQWNDDLSKRLKNNYMSFFKGYGNQNQNADAQNVDSASNQRILDNSPNGRRRGSPGNQSPGNNPITRPGINQSNDPFQAMNDENYQTIMNMLQGNYQGPGSIENVEGFDKTLQSVNNAARQAEQLGSNNGRVDFLQEMYGEGSRSGLAQLDNLLLGGQNEMLQRAASGAEGLSDSLQKGIEESRGQQAGFQEKSNALREAFEGEGGIVEKLLGEGRNTMAEQEEIKNQLRGRDRQNYYAGVNQEQYDMLRALNQLLGSNYEF